MRVLESRIPRLTIGTRYGRGVVTAAGRSSLAFAVHWGGVNNTYAHNVVSLGPHNCMLGGGNEVPSDVGGVGNVFEYNVLEQCAFESSDTGAFYSCGQQATAFVNPANELRHNVFRDIVNTEGSGVQAITIQAVYLDDQMSAWHVWNNSFYNCTTGTFVGGGRWERPGLESDACCRGALGSLSPPNVSWHVPCPCPCPCPCPRLAVPPAG